MSFSRFNRFIISLLILFLVYQSPVISQSTGKIVGTVTDASTGEALPGANVFLAGTNHGVSTDRYGKYTIDKIKPGTYTITASYIGYEQYKGEILIADSRNTVNIDIQLPITAVQIDDIVVSGLLQGQVKALNQQLNSQDIRNVLSREEMEKFPDLNTADALKRIPGVNVSRSLGEGTHVYIRGSEPRLTGVLVDGQKIASSDDEERIIDLGIINSSELSSIELTKALTPDMDADAIGGAVNLVTKSPFDYERANLKLDVGGGYAFQGKNPLYRASGAYTGFAGENNQFGYTVSGSFYRNNITGHSTEMTWDNVKDANGATIPWALTDFNLFNYDTRRDHLGLSTALEYKLNKNNSFHLRGLYNLKSDDQSRDNIQFRPSKGTYLNATTISNGRMAFSFQDRLEKHTIYGIALGGVHQLDAMNIDYDINYSNARQQKTDPGQIKSDWALNTKLNWLIDLSDVEFPKFTTTNKPNEYYQDAANWEIDSQDYRTTDIKNDIITANLNLKMPYDLFGLPAELKAGTKLNIDKKDKVASRAKYKWKGSSKVFMNSVSDNETISDFLNDKYTFAPMISKDAVRNFFNQNRGLSNGLVETLVYDDTDGSGGNYTNKENVYAFYLMTTFNVDALSVLAGARDEYTTTDYEGNKILVDPSGNFLSMTPVNNTKNYNNIFPYAHLKYKFTELMNLRFAVTRTIARPNFFDLAPYYWLNESGKSITQGNPNLIPTIATNVDLMFENYFQGIGVFSFGLFYKDMDKVIYTRTYQQVGGVYDGYAINEPVNGGSAKLYGFEVNWMQQFTFLPGFLNGFGIYANYTYTKSEADLQYRNWSTMPGQAADVGNIGLSYEKYGLTTRLSLNYNAEVLYQVGVNPDYDRYNAKRTNLDLTVVYKVLPNLSVYGDWVNITNQPDKEYYGVTSRPRLSNYLGTSMRAGVKFEL